MLAQKEIIKKNLKFILSHFNGQEYKFPRAIMTLKTKSQIYTNNEEETFQHFLEADFTDCRINGYPFFDDVNILSPSFIFINLDLSLCNICKYPKRKLDYILKQTLNKIEKEIKGIPTVLWTGEGYHIYQPIIVNNPKYRERPPLEFVTQSNEFLPYVNNNLTNEFMRFAVKYFTANLKNLKHNPSIKSCFIMIPETINSKYNFIVEIIQKWDGREANANTIISCFLENLKH
jgi:hypothetical protein